MSEFKKTLEDIIPYLKAEERSFQSNYLDKDSYSTRLLNSDPRVPNPAQKDDTTFKHGFQFEHEPDDKQCVPKSSKDGNDMFRQFYCALVKTNILNSYIIAVENFFETNGIENNGCLMATETARFENSHKEFTEFGENFISPKVTARSRKGMNAKETIEEGEVILKEKAPILCKTPSCICSKYHYFECSYCTKSSNRFYVCHLCSVTIYCSENCRSVAYHEYHQYECKAHKCHFFGKNDSLVIAFRMLMMGTLYKFDTNTRNKYQYICSVSDSDKDIDKLKALRGATLVLLYLKKYTDYFSCEAVKARFPNLTPNQMLLAVGGVFIKHVWQAYNGTIYFPDEMISLTSHTAGILHGTPALCVLASKITHTCKPNAAIVMKNNYYHIKALRKILPKESITINYVHLDESFYGHSKKFCCKCSQCNRKTYWGRFYVCYKCKGKKFEKWCGDEVDIWLCMQCNSFQSNETMEANVMLLDSLFDRIKNSSDFKDVSSSSKVFLDTYEKVYAHYYPEYLYVLQKMFALAVEDLDLNKTQQYANLIFAKTQVFLNKYSLRKVDILASMVNCVATIIFKKEMRLRRFINIAKTALEHLKPLCEFYMIDGPFLELSELLNNIDRKYKADKSEQMMETDNKKVSDGRKQDI